MESLFLGEGLALSPAAVSLPGLCYRTDSALQEPDLCVLVVECCSLAGESCVLTECVCACVSSP